MGVNPADDKQVPPEPPAEQGGQPEAQLNSRRRMLRRSLGVAAPVVLTLASNPVSATTTCVEASTFVSQVAMSSRQPAGQSCSGGWTPSSWASCSTSSWPSSCKQSGTADGTKKLCEVFGYDVISQWNCGFNNNTTLKQAMSCSNGVARDVCAGYVSACAGHFATILTATEMRNCWRGLALNGVYKPKGSTTISWNGATTQAWLTYMR